VLAAAGYGLTSTVLVTVRGKVAQPAPSPAAVARTKTP
jgi:hypothetical protein